MSLSHRHGADRPGRCRLPAWYRANPGRAATWRSSCSPARAEHADEPDHQRPLGASAFGTASSAALTSADTVYSVTPPLPPVRAADVPSGARSSAVPGWRWPALRPGHVLGGGAPLRRDRRLVHVDDAARARRRPAAAGRAPPPGPAVHGLGDAAQVVAPGGAAVRPARVLEFYASTEAGAILVNLGDAKPGAMGRPLPGAPEVGWPPTTPTTTSWCSAPEGSCAAAPRASRDAAGTRARDRHDRDDTAPGRVRQGRQLALTGDIFRQDDDGDYWRLDGASDVIRTAQGAVFTAPIREALGELPAVDLAVAYGVRLSDGRLTARRRGGHPARRTGHSSRAPSPPRCADYRRTSGQRSST